MAQVAHPYGLNWSDLMLGNKDVDIFNGVDRLMHMTTTKTTECKWALYYCGDMIAEGTAEGSNKYQGMGEAGKAAVAAMFADHERRIAALGDARYVPGVIDAERRLYRWSCWGPRGGSLRYLEQLCP